MRTLFVVVVGFGLASSARADDLSIVGAAKVAVIDPEVGYVGDPFAFDAAGRRLLWLLQGVPQPRAEMYDIAQLAPLRRFDLPDESWTDLAFALDDQHVFATQREREQLTTGWLVGADGRSRRFGPADDVLLVNHGDTEVALLHWSRPAKANGVRHVFEVRDLVTGAKRRRAQLDMDAHGFISALDFRAYGFTDGFTRAFGEKGGRWDPEENQRTPNHHATYDVLRGAFTAQAPIADLMEYRRTMLARQEHSPAAIFAYVADGTELWRVGENGRTPIELEEPLSHYDVRSVVNQPLADGTLIFSMRIDPVHPDAARQKRAETPWTDVYLLEPGATKAVRKARVVDPNKRTLRWRATREFLAVLPGHRGFERGGEKLYLFDWR